MNKLSKGNIFKGKFDLFVVPLKAKILQKGVHNKYVKYLEWMIKAGIIETDNRYEPDRISKGYRFTEHYLNSGIRLATVTCSKVLTNQRKQKNSEFTYMKRIVQGLKRLFVKERLGIDADGANALIEKLWKETKFTKNNAHKVNLRFANYRSSVKALQQGNYEVSQDDYGYRIYTPITKLSKKFRKFVTFDGKAMVELDLSGSQLFFILFLLNSNNWSKNQRRKHKEIWKDIEIINNRDNYSNTNMIIVNAENQYGKGFQQHQYFQDCLSGKIYDLIAEQTGFTRKKVKNILIKQLFASQHRPEHAELYQGDNRLIYDCFTGLYPEVEQVLTEIKNCHYKDLSRLLQRIETTAMLRVCQYLQKQYPDVPIFTLHDCLVTTVGNELLVQQVMKDRIQDFIGYPPKIKIDYWKETKVSSNMNLKKAA